MKTILSILLTSAVALTASAQDNPDWQIGGGYDSGTSTNKSYSIDLPQSQRRTISRPAQPAQHPATYDRYNAINLFNGGHDDAKYALTIGYVNKYWRTDFGTHTWHENFWGEEGKRLHGFQLGFVYQPCLPVGLGLHTGLFWESYISVSPAVREQGWDDFTENGLYIPLHGMWRIPFDRHSSFMIYAGFGINWAIAGYYNERYEVDSYSSYSGWTHERVTDSEYATYGRGDWPRHFNTSAEFGVSLRLKHTQCSLTISQGLTDHGFYHNDGNYKTTQNKLAFSIACAM